MKFSGLFRPESGQALIETALLLPLILIIIWGVIQLGFIYSTSFVVKYAAYAGARAGMVDGRNAQTRAGSTVRQVVGGTVDKLVLAPGAGRMRLSVKVLNTGKDIEVQTGYRMPLRFPLAGKFFADGPFSISPLDGHFYRTLSARYRLRMETGGRSQGAE
ncbi:MAG: pilus assembly protein [Firmicutes bacterium]|nr:pilus assembly protein [Bacillota bacterium]